MLQASQRQSRDQVLDPCNQRRRWVCEWACEVAMDGAAQDPSQQRGGVKEPRRGPGPILDAAPQRGRDWAEPWGGTRELVGEEGR